MCVRERERDRKSVMCEYLESVCVSGREGVMHLLKSHAFRLVFSRRLPNVGSLFLSISIIRKALSSFFFFATIK